MKIGILTFHCAHNYGAVLQTYALVTYLRKNNYDAEIIDYRPKSLTMSHGIMPWRRISRLNIIRKVIFVLRILPFLTVRKERSDKFQSFIDPMQLVLKPNESSPMTIKNIKKYSPILRIFQLESQSLKIFCNHS